MSDRMVLGLPGTLKRVWAIAHNVFRELLRDRIFYLLALYGIGLLLTQQLLPQIASTTAPKVLLDISLAAMAVLSLMLAVFVGTGLINREVEKRTVFILMAKPVSRTEFILGKYVGLSGVLALLIAGMAAIATGILQWAQISFAIVDFWIAAGFLCVQLSVVSAIALLFGIVTSSLLAGFLTFGVYGIGQLSQDVVKFSKLAQNDTLVTVIQTLYLLLPDFARLDLKNQAVYHLIPGSEVLLGHVLYATLYIIFILAIASLVASAQEF